MARNAQDIAVAGCVIERGLLRAPEMVSLNGPPGTLARSLIERGLVPAPLVSLVIRELGAGQFVCAGCGKAIAYPGLGKLNSLLCPGCGAELEFRTAEEQVPTAGIPERIGPYRVQRELGRGGMGVVYLAQSERGEQVALKVLLGRRASGTGSERFRIEAAVAARLDHPGIVPVHDDGVHGGRPYYVMPYVAGPTLAERLRERGAFPPDEAAALVTGLALAVAEAHDAGVIHRDLKPGNVILEEGTGAPRITDFGLARDLNQSMSMTRSGEVLGTPHYMAPEQMEDAKRVGTSADVYALGVILYECLTGVRPFEANALLDLYNQIMRGRPTPPRDLEPNIPPSIERACLSALERKAEDRPFDARAFSEALTLGGEEQPPARARGRGRAAGLAAAGLGLLLLAGAMLAVAMARKGREPEPEPSRSPPTIAASAFEAALAEVDALHLRSAPYPQILRRLAQMAPLAKTPAERSRHVRAQLELAFRRLQIERALDLARSPDLLGRHALEARLLAGILARRLGNAPEAIRQLEALGERDRSVVGASAKAYASQLKRGAEGPDPTLVAEALRLDPTGPFPRLFKFYDQLLRQKDLVAAEQTLQGLIAEAPDNWLYLWSSVTLVRKRRGDAAAVGALNTLIAAVAPSLFPEAVLIRSQLQLELKDDNAALAGLNQVLAHPAHRNDIRARVLRGALRGRRKNFGGRQEDFVHAALHDPHAFLVVVGPEMQARALRIVVEGLRWRGAQLLSPGMKSTLRERMKEVPKAAAPALSNTTQAMMRGSPWNRTMDAGLKRGRAAAPRSAAVLVQVAEVLLGRDRLDEAGSALQAAQAVANSPAMRRKLALLGARLSERRGDEFAAAAAYQRLAREASTNEGLLASAARTSLRGGDLGAAQAQVARVLAQEPNDFTALTLRAWLALGRGQLLEALRWVRAGLLRGAAVDGQLIAAQGLALRGIDARLGRFARGRSELTTTLELGGGWVRAAAVAAVLSSEKREGKDLVWARKLLREGLAQEPRRVRFHTLLGELSIAEERPLEEVLEHLERAKELEPRLTFPELAAAVRKSYPRLAEPHRERLKRLGEGPP